MSVRKTPAPVAPLPEFTSDRLRLLGPLITPRVLELARARILAPKSRLVAGKGDIPTGDSEAVVKIALLLVREINAAEDFTNEEEGLLRGMTADTFGKRRAAREI